MAHILKALLLCISLLLVCFIHRSLVNRRLARQYGCSPLRAFYPHLDPIFGLDLLFKTILAVKNHTHLKDTHNRFDLYGATYHALSLGQHVFHTVDPSNVRAIYSTAWTSWHVEPMRLQAMEPMCGRGFITTDGETWRRSRALLKPSFNKACIEDLTTFRPMVDEFVENLPKDGSTIDLIPRFYELFLDTAGVFLLGKGFGAVSSVGHGHKSDARETQGSNNQQIDPQVFLDAFHASETWMGIRMLFGGLGRLASRARWQALCRTVHDFIDRSIEQAMREQLVDYLMYGEPQPQEDTLPPHTLLRSLTKLTKDRYEIRYQIIQALMATQDTTSTLLSNTFFLLSRAPEMWKRLRSEALMTSDPPTVLELKKSRFLINVVNESLRVHPPFPFHYRTAIQPTTLPSGGGSSGTEPIFIPAGSLVATSTYTVHRNVNVFGNDVEVFNPDRWNSIEPQAWEFFPFGVGARRCLGEDKARLEAAYILCTMARKVRHIGSRDARPYEGETKLSVRNANGVLVAFTS